MSRVRLVTLVSSFTAEPLVEPLALFLRGMVVPAAVVPAPYGQVFQTLLDEASPLRTAGTVGVIAVRLEDFWHAGGEGGAADTMPGDGELDALVTQLGDALRVAHDGGGATMVVCLCPPSPAVGQALGARLAVLEAHLAEQVVALPRMRVLTSDALVAALAQPWHDEDRDRLGHVPYTPVFFAKLAGRIARLVYAVAVPARKVIAVDGDNTLWMGVLGEDGVEGITLDAGRRELQEFLIAQQQDGMLLCLVSKNNEADVRELFERRTDLPLRPEHFVAWRVSWERKSAGLQSLADELSLGLDSFVFLDDSLMECEEVATSCPEVLTIPMPHDASALEIVRDTWAFDRWVVTEEDRQRTAMYQQGRARDAVRRATPSLDAFIAQLGVQVDVSTMAPQHLARAAQLTQRTNQFNTTTVRRSEGELGALAARGDAEVLVAHVRDRFGDYGLTGLVVAIADGAVLRVDTLLLSCRVLARGVEQRIVEELARIAATRGCGTVEFPFIRTKRNAPAEQFLSRFSSEFRTATADGFVVRLPAAEIAALNRTLPSVEAPVEEPRASAPEVREAMNPSHVAARLRTLARDPERVLHALAAQRRRPRPEDAGAVRAPASDVERALVSLWSEILGVDPVGADDNFFAFGGDSLLGTLLLSRARAVLEAALPLRAVFEAPTPAQLARWALANPQSVRATDGGAQRIPVRGAGSPPTLSRGQIRLWAMQRLNGPSSAFNVPTAFAVEGVLDANALDRALREIMLRHEVLRSRITEHEGIPSLETVNVPGRVLAEVDGPTGDEASRLLDEEASRPFDLASGQLLRALLVRVGTTESRLVITMHHIASDGWSQGVLVRELGALYEAFAAGGSSPLAPLTAQFADVVAWEQAQAGRRDAGVDLAFWRSSLADAPVLALPTDHPRAATQGQAGGHVHFTLPATAAAAVRRLSLEHGVTPFITLLASYVALLHRRAGQDDLVVGSAVANRPHEDAAPLIGFFVNTLAVRVQVSAAMTFASLIRAVRDAALGAQEHALPFDEVVEAVRRPVDPARHPLFQAAFVLQNWAMPELGVTGARPIPVETGGSQLDLQLSLRESAEGIEGTLEYDSALFERATAKELVECYSALLTSALERPGAEVGALSLLTNAQHARLMRFGRAGGDHPGHVTTLFHEMFEAHALRMPDAVALRFDGAALTYEALNARANRVAHTLLGAGVGVETLVGLCVDRSLEQVVGMLAILKAGAAFVPLDPRYPRERLRMMLEDSAAPVVLTAGGGAALLEGMSTQVLDVAACASADVAASNPDVPLHAGNLAYVIYTSGSTGKPKGTLIEHRGLANFAHYFPSIAGQESARRVLQFASPSFDASISEYVLALGQGGTLVVPTRDQVQSWPDLVELLRRERITFATLPPALLRASIPESFPELLTLIAAGEASSPDIVNTWAPGRRMLNGYGPTEVTIAASFGVCVAGDTRPPAIGTPVPNSVAYVVDPRGALLPPGAQGELLVGGAGLARGYLNRPETTAERFVTTWVSGTEERVYRTGDLVRWRDDGNLEFIGRVDDQVKIRGHRVELGEIENVLRRVEGVRDAVAIVREDTAGDRRLIAYVVAPSMTPDAIRTALQGELPEYMVPAAVVPMSQFPLSPNGKVDRKALPAPDLSLPNRGSDYLAPRTATERELAKIWSQVLKVPEIGVHDDFFALGGDSILSIQVLSRAASAGIALTARQLFKTPTIAALAEAAATASPAAVAADDPVPEGDVLLTPIQRWFFAMDLPEQAYWNQAFVFTLRGDIDADRLERALVRTAERHDSLRLRFRRTGGHWKQSYGASANLVLDRIDLSDAAPAERGERVTAAAIEIQESLNLSRGPLIAAAHVTFGADEPGRLIVVAHHLVIDGVSWRILIEDVESAYLALTEGRVVAFPPRTTSYQRWAERLHAAGGARVGDEVLEHWRALQGLRTELNGQRSGGENLERDARTVIALLTEAETTAIVRDLPQRTGASALEAMLAALGVALHDAADARALVVDVEGHGREPLFDDVDLSRSVGWFTSIYPVAVPTLLDAGEALSQVRAHLRDVPSRGADLLALREFATDENVQQVLRAIPRPTIVFNYLGHFDQVVGDSKLFSFAPETTGAWHAPDGRRAYDHEVGAIIRDGRLELSWTYDARRYERDQIAASLTSMRDALAQLSEAGEATEGASSAPRALPWLSAEQLASLESVAPVDDAYPLSPVQAGLLFHALANPESPAYQIQSRWTLRGPLEVERYRRAWDALVARHPILRTEFVWEDVPQPLQIVRQIVEVPWREDDWRPLSEAERTARMEGVLRADLADRFDLARAPLMRVALVRTADDVHEVIWSFHHVLLDGWSGALITKELQELYEAEVEGRTPVLAPLRPYRDYIEALQRADADSEAYWRRHLDGIEAATPLGIDHPAHAGEARFSECVLELPADAMRTLRELARANRVTLNVVMQAAWAIVLRCYSGEDDVVFGETATNRPATLTGVEHMVGLFLNTVPVRVGIDATAPASVLLRDLKAEQAERMGHESAPLTDITRWSSVAPGTPLFESLLVFENYPSTPTTSRRPLVDVSDVRTEERTHYPLTLTIVPGERLSIRGMYDARRFDGENVARALVHLRTVLETLASGTDIPVGDISLVTAEERTRLVDEWNATGTAYPRDALVADLFDEVARTRDTAVALVHGDITVSYAELAARAAALASELREAGVAPGDMVGICIDRSPGLIVSMLAVLSVGAAYVPIDPAYPTERHRFILEDTATPLILVQPEHVPVLRDACAEVGASRPVLLAVALDGTALESSGPRTPARHRRADDEVSAAYVMYTSGSTGRPKGVLVPHRAIIRLVRDTNYVQLGPDDVVLGFAPSAFDAATFEVWGALLNGATLVLAPQGAPDLAALGELVAREGVTTLWLTSALFQQVVDFGLSQYHSVRNFLAGGDVLSVPHVRRALQQLPGSRLINGYGPTENTTFTCTYEVPRTWPEGRAIPIGRPVANTRVYVLDARQQLLPIGVPGELVAAGDGVALGYLARPELTAERFVPDSFAATPGGRMYRTGDRVRYANDGTIEFLGRFDDQVKIRGFRVEPGEVETVLATCPGVREGVVVVRKSSTGAAQLVAYYVPAEGGTLGSAELRAYLRERLPEYLVPARLVRLDALPISPTGKVDRRRLPEPTDLDAQPDAARVAPRTPVEETLAAIWRTVLRREAIGVTDNFFELGGDSILSIQIAARAREAGLKVGVSSLRTHPTIAEQATLAESARAGDATVEPRATGRAPLTPIQRWFFEQEFLDRNHWNQAFVLESHERLRGGAMRTALAALLDTHDALRLRFTRRDGTWEQRFVDGGEVPFEEVTLSSGNEAAEFAERAARAHDGVDIEHGPLIRVVLAHGPEGDRLLLVVHHLVVDGVSWRILVEDLEQAYSDAATAAPVRPLQRTTSYQRWADALVAYAGSETVRGELTYWRTVLDHAESALPVDIGSGGSNTVADEARVIVSLDERETADLLQRVPAAYSTQINDVLLTALAGALAPWKAGSDLLIGMEGHGREDVSSSIDTSRTVGWFTSIFPFRLPLAGAEDIGASLLAIKEQLRAVPRRGLGYGVLRYLADASLPRTEPELVFNYLGQFESAHDTGILRYGPLDAAGAWVGERSERPHRVAVNAFVIGGRLQVDWSYSRDIHEEATITRLAEGMQASLRRIIEHAVTPGVGRRSPSDYPLVSLTQDEVDRLAGTGRDVEDILPVAPLQALFLATAAGEMAHGFEQLVIELEGKVDPEGMRRAWELVGQRHQILRTEFVSALQGGPVQVIRRRGVVPVEVHDLRTLAPDAAAARILDIAAENRARGFDPARLPLQRVSLVQKADDAWSLIWSYQHLLLERWSVPILLSEVGSTYAAVVHGDATTLPDAPQWRHYMAWLASRPREQDIAWWASALEGANPAALPRLSNSAAPDGEVSLQLNEHLSEAVGRLARACHTSTNAVIATAWALWLARVTGRDDVTFGIAVAVRPDEVPNIRRLVGMCLNNIPLRLHHEARDTGRELVTNQAAHMDQAVRHAHVALPDIQRASGLAWHHRLFDTLLVFHHHDDDAAVASWMGPGIRTLMVHGEMRTNYPLTLVVGGQGMLRLRLAYRGQVADAPTASRVLQSLAAVLDALTTSPEARVEDLLGSMSADVADQLADAVARDQTAARSDAEWVVASIWSELLGRERLGVHEDFFALGGQSLVATQILARLNEAFQMTLPISMLFEHPTVARFTEALVARELFAGQVDRIAVIVRQVEEMTLADARGA